MKEPIKEMQKYVRQIAKISKECGIDAKKKLKTNFMGPVLAWCRGFSLQNVCRMTYVFEEDILVCIERLKVLMREMFQVSKILNCIELELKFKEIIQSLQPRSMYPYKPSFKYRNMLTRLSATLRQRSLIPYEYYNLPDRAKRNL